MITFLYWLSRIRQNPSTCTVCVLKKCVYYITYFISSQTLQIRFRFLFNFQNLMLHSFIHFYISSILLTSLKRILCNKIGMKDFQLTNGATLSANFSEAASWRSVCDLQCSKCYKRTKHVRVISNSAFYTLFRQVF